MLILAIGALAAHWLSRELEEPEPEQSERQRMQTAVRELLREDYQVVLESQGIVRAHHETPLTSSVAGTIRRIDEKFEDGAYFREDDVLLELAPGDFEAAVESAKSQLARAEAALAQEEALANQARRNWDDLGYEEEPSDLVLRIPQLKEATADVKAAAASLEQARRDLARTKIRAPFDGRVRERLVGLGQSVGASTALGNVFATDFAEIRLPLAADQLGFVDLPSRPDDPPVSVTLIDALTVDADAERSRYPARIVRTEGALDENSRELFAIARIDDPFGLESGKPPLRIGQPVRARIEGRVLEDVFVLARDALRDIDRVYLVDRGEDPVIVRQLIEPIWSTDKEIVVREGLSEGQWLSTTRLPYAPDGAPVEILDSPSGEDETEDGAPSTAARLGDS
jgi:RND family efflux transporter MFP subunit